MTERAYYRCDGCDKEYPESHDFGQIPHYWERVSAGSMVPAGECEDEECGALVYPIEATMRVSLSAEALAYFASFLCSGKIITADCVRKAVNGWNALVERQYGSKS